MKRTLARILALALMLCVFAGCAAKQTPAADAAADAPASTETTDTPAAETPAEAKDVVIALCIPLSGASADAGRMAQDGAELAVNYINEHGGVAALGGAQLKLSVYDTTSDADQAKNVVERAITEDGVVAVIGCGTSALTLPSIPACEKAQIPLVTYSNSADLTNQGYQYIFSVSPTAVNVGSATPEFLSYLNNDAGYSFKKVAIIHEDSDNGNSVAEGYVSKAETYGLEIVYNESFQANLTDASSIATAIKNSGADVIMASCNVNDNMLLVNAMNAINFAPMWLGVSCWASFGEDMGEYANGMVANSNWNYKSSTILNNPEYVAITESFDTAYAYPMAEQSGSAFVCVKLIADALELTGTYDTVALRDAISANTFESMMQPGLIKFDENGINTLATVGVCQWQDGECVCVWPDDLAGAAFVNPADYIK